MPPDSNIEPEILPPEREGGAPTPRQSRAVGDPFTLALMIAIIADALQILFFPLFIEGGLPALNDALDVAVFLIMVRLLGWHWVFLPSFLGELVPVLNEAPTWTAAVLYLRWQRRNQIGGAASA